MPLGHKKVANKANPYNAFSRLEPKRADSVDAGELNTQTVVARRPTTEQQNLVETLRRRKKIATQDTVDRFLGAIFAGDGASLNWSIPKTDLKGEAGREDLKNKRINQAIKTIGFFHRYPFINCGYAGRSVVLFGNRVNQAVLNVPKLSKTFDTETYKAISIASAPFSAAYGGFQWLGCAYGTYKLGYSIYADVKSHPDRKRYKAIADKFDMYHGDTEKANAMSDLLNKDRGLRASEGGQVHKSLGQVAADRIAAASESLYIKPFIGTAALMSMSPSKFVLSTVAPGYTVGVQTMMAGVYGWRFGVQIAAMNNAFWAADKTKNIICKNTSKNIINERVVKSRVNGGRLIGYTFNCASNVAGYAIGATGVGVPAIPALAAIGSGFMAVTHMGVSMYDYLYTRKTEKLRAMSIKSFESDWKHLPKSTDYSSREEFEAARNKFFSEHSYGRKNIGWTEKALVRMLRGSNLTLRTQAVNYLLELGFSTQTIKRIQVENKEVVALKSLETNLYANRLRHNWRANKYLHKSLGESAFISAGIRNVKKLHQMRKEYCARHANRVNPVALAA